MPHLTTWLEDQCPMYVRSNIKGAISEVDSKMGNMRQNLLHIQKGEGTNDLIGWVVIEKYQSQRKRDDLVGVGTWCMSKTL